MSSSTAGFFLLLQLFGLLAVLVGVALLLPLGWALVADGALVLVSATAFEVVVTRPHRAPSEPASRPKPRAVA